MGIDGQITIRMKFKNSDSAAEFKNELEKAFKQSTLPECYFSDITLKATDCYCELNNDNDRNLCTQYKVLKDFLEQKGLANANYGTFTSIARHFNCFIEIRSLYDSGMPGGIHHTIIDDGGYVMAESTLYFPEKYELSNVESVIESGTWSLDKLVLIPLKSEDTETEIENSNGNGDIDDDFPF